MEAGISFCTCNIRPGFCRFHTQTSSNGGVVHVHQHRHGHGNSNGNRGGGSLLYTYLPRLILALISGALTAVFALAGAFAGAVIGAIAGHASHSGVFRGAGLGAVAGAVLSVEILEASRAYWCSEISSSRSSPSMADFIEKLLEGRLVRERLVHTVLTDYHWQVRTANLSYDRMYAPFDEVTSRGLSGESLKKQPHHVVTGESKSDFGGSMCCTICLQDMEVGQTVRSLRQCHHLFHLSCVDKWLVSHDSCPVCRRTVE